MGDERGKAEKMDDKTVVEIGLTIGECDALISELECVVRRCRAIMPRWQRTRHGQQVTTALATVKMVRILARHRERVS